MQRSFLLRFTLLTCFLSFGCERPNPVAGDPSRIRFEVTGGVGSDWSEPVNLGPPINTSSSDQAPVLSPDGLSLYFGSDRPGSFGNTDLWVSHRVSEDSPWQTPVNLGAPINTAAVESGPNLSRDGLMLFFQSSRPGGQGSNDIYVSRRTNPHDDLGWGAPMNLGPDVNSSIGEFGPWFQEHDDDGPMLYFARGPVNTFTDIYAAPMTHTGQPRGPAHLVTELSDPNFTDGRPTVAANGKEIIFFSARLGSLGSADLWRSTRPTVHDAWSQPVNLGAPPNTSDNDLLPFLTRNGHTLLFTSDRIGYGGFDIWMSTRLARDEEDDRE